MFSCYIILNVAVAIYCVVSFPIEEEKASNDKNKIPFEEEAPFDSYHSSAGIENHPAHHQLSNVLIDKNHIEWSTLWINIKEYDLGNFITNFLNLLLNDPVVGSFFFLISIPLWLYVLKSVSVIIPPIFGTINSETIDHPKLDEGLEEGPKKSTESTTKKPKKAKKGKELPVDTVKELPEISSTPSSLKKAVVEPLKPECTLETLGHFYESEAAASHIKQKCENTLKSVMAFSKGELDMRHVAEYCVDRYSYIVGRDPETDWSQHLQATVDNKKVPYLFRHLGPEESVLLSINHLDFAFNVYQQELLKEGIFIGKQNDTCLKEFIKLNNPDLIPSETFLKVFPIVETESANNNTPIQIEDNSDKKELKEEKEK